MIFAAGTGTRLYPLTKDKPKALVEFRGKTLLENCITYLNSFGIKELVINVHHFADKLCDYLEKNENFGLSISISDERTELLETGGGLKKASQNFGPNEDFLVCNVDILTDLNLSELIHQHKANDALATLAVRKRDTSRYLLFNPKMELAGWTNKKTGEVKMSRPSERKLMPFAFSGIHVINSSIFDLIEENGKFSIIDLYLRLATNHKIMAYDHSHGYWFDMGKPENLDEADRLFPK
jgi:NDP-sugar pyrophosphorylase family protein